MAPKKQANVNYEKHCRMAGVVSYKELQLLGHGGSRVRYKEKMGHAI